MQPREDEVRNELVAQWVGKAQEDLRAAALLLSEDPPLLFASCFHCQQAVEKYLKAYLVQNQTDFPKTHDIQQLLDIVQLTATDLAEALSPSIILTQYAVQARYPGDLPEPGPEETEAALAIARQVRDSLSPLLSPGAASEPTP